MAHDHILLMGIDAYRGQKPLLGAANDVDAMARIWLDRIGVSPTAITKLVARHGPLRPDEHLPTLANIRAELDKLAGNSVQAGDRVFIHFSGHGTRIPSPASLITREALVPMDVDECKAVLFDYELNGILHKIAQRTNDVTVVMDCCFSASVTRGAFPLTQVRTCRIRGIVAENHATTPAGFSSPASPSDPGYLVVASAQSGEPAEEVRDTSGTWHSAFMAAFLEFLSHKFTGNLHELRWVDAWPSLRAGVASKNPGQHPCLIGRSERRVFGGPYRPGDPGITLEQKGDHILVHAGSLAGLSKGAEIGVYGPDPAYFAPLGLPSDKQMRRGVLRVQSVNLASAKATFSGKPMALSQGDRGRLIKPGPRDRLVVALDPWDDTVARNLETTTHVKVVEFGRDDVEVVVGQTAHGRYWIGDMMYGAETPLVVTKPGDIRGLARGLLHYAQFNVPLRLTRRSVDGGHRLALTVLNAKQVTSLRREVWPNPPLPTMNADMEGGCHYLLTEGDNVCFSVWNLGPHPLYLHLLNCTASGKVQLLGTQQVDTLPGQRHIFYEGGVMPEAFEANVSPGRSWNIDRLVAIGTVSAEVDLRCLEVTNTFADAVGSTRRGEEGVSGVGAEWVATTVKVRIVQKEKGQ